MKKRKNNLPVAIVTKIKPQKAKKRLNIFLDGKYAFSLLPEEAVKEKIKIGAEISSEKIQNLIKESDFQVSLEKAYNFLSFRPRSLAEVTDYLTKKGVGEETGKQVIDKLQELRMVDDLKFSQWWLEQRQTFRPIGKKLLALELKKKGIAREIVDQVLADQRETDEILTARQLLSKKSGRWQNLTFAEFRKKAGDFLLRRGFSWETVNGLMIEFKKDFSG